MAGDGGVGEGRACSSGSKEAYRSWMTDLEQVREGEMRPEAHPQSSTHLFHDISADFLKNSIYLPWLPLSSQDSDLHGWLPLGPSHPMLDLCLFHTSRCPSFRAFREQGGGLTPWKVATLFLPLWLTPGHITCQCVCL